MTVIFTLLRPQFVNYSGAVNHFPEFAAAVARGVFTGLAVTTSLLPAASSIKPSAASCIGAFNYDGDFPHSDDRSSL